MPVSNDYFQYVIEQLDRLPQVTSRRMFSAMGINCCEPPISIGLPWTLGLSVVRASQIHLALEAYAQAAIRTLN